MVDLLRYEHGIYAFDANYIRPQLAAIHLIVENDQVAVVDTANNAALPHALDALRQRCQPGAHPASEESHR